MMRAEIGSETQVTLFIPKEISSILSVKFYVGMKIDKNSLLEKHNVHQNIARDLYMPNPKYETQSQSEK